MNEILEKFHYLKSLKSDINEHLETLKKYSEECETIIEMGVRGVVSTWAFLAAKPKKITCYDISNLSLHYPEELAKKNDIVLNFIQANVLDVEIEHSDLLFLDTIHRYHQLFYELNLHAKKIKKYIVMHDTVTYAYVDEPIYLPNFKSPDIENKKGLSQAISDFLRTEEGNNWFVYETYENNNGLTILKRKS